MALQRVQVPSFVRDRLAADPVRLRAFTSACWPHLVGAQIASRTQVLKIENATLVVGVPDASWRRELHRLAPALLGRLRELLGAAAPRRLGFMEARPAAAPARTTATKAPPAVPAVPSAGILEAAAAIPEPALRDLFIRSATGYLHAFAGEAADAAGEGERG